MGKNRQAKELLEVSDEIKALSKWGLENMRRKQRLTKELLEVRAGNETWITALQDALQRKESHLETAKGEVLKLLKQLKAQEERCQGDLKKEARETRLREKILRQLPARARERKGSATIGSRELQGVFLAPPVLRRTYRGWPARTAARGRGG